MTSSPPAHPFHGELIAVTRLPTPWGEFLLHAFQFGDAHHLALAYGNIDDSEVPLVRLHSECLTGDALFSLRCDCGLQLESALEAIATEGRGLLLYLKQEGRGIGLLNKLKAYALQDQGMDTVDANLALDLKIDAREYGVCKTMLDHFGIKRLRLMTNNPDKAGALVEMGFQVDRVATVLAPNAFNSHYLATKAARLGHLLDV